MSFADDQIVYRDLAGPWGSFRLVIGGQDVTRFRGAPAQIGGYQLQEPYGYGPAEFAFPQITGLEADVFGAGELDWLDLEKHARLVQVDGNGDKVRVVWRGFVTNLSVDADGVTVHCDGECSGRLAMREKQPELFYWVKDVGSLLDGTLRRAGLRTAPDFGRVTGVEVYERNLSTGSFLSYCDDLLAQTATASEQLTIMPDADGVYVQQWKDPDTIHAAVYNGAAGVTVSVARDLQEEPNTIYGHGRSPDGLQWVNGKYPGLIQGDPPAFPGTMNLGDSGPDVETLQSKLIGTGYLDREDAVGGFDDETEDAVKDLQRDAGLSVTGTVNSATWDSLFDLGDTGLSLRNAHVAPLAQKSFVRQWDYTSNGSKAGPNAGFDPDRVQVDQTFDFGSACRKRRARRWSWNHLDRLNGGKNWVGTVTLATDVFLPGGAETAIMSRLDLDAGMNLRVHNFDGNTKFHVSGVNVSSDLTVSLAVDTKARDLLTLGQIIERNRESRTRPARQWLRERRRGTSGNEQIVEWSEVGGRLWNAVHCDADAWTVFPIVAGQSGSVKEVRIHVSDNQCEFAAAITAQRVSRAWWHQKVANPFDTVAQLLSITLTSAGSSYETVPTVELSGGGGSGAHAVATVRDGKVTSVRFTNRGSGYTSAPSVSITGGGGSGADAVVHFGVTGSSRWESDAVQQQIEDARVLLGVWGTVEQPGGYYPHKKTGDDGNPTGAPITGTLLDDAGFDYYTFDEPVLWVAVYPKQACTIRPQRIFWPVLEAGT